MSEIHSNKVGHSYQHTKCECFCLLCYLKKLILNCLASQGTECSKEVAILHHLEKQVAIERGKGVKSKTVIKVIEVCGQQVPKNKLALNFKRNCTKY